MLKHNQLDNQSNYNLTAADMADRRVYFISFCVYQSQSLLGSIEEDLQLNELGHLVADEWLQRAADLPDLRLDAFIVMPNHFHAIVALPGSSSSGEESKRVSDALVGTIIQSFKAAARERVNKHRNMPDAPLWQPDFHTRPIRNYPSLEAFRRYIADNPSSWPVDPLNPESPNPHPSCYIAPRDSN